MIRFENVTKSFGPPGSQKTILENVSFEVATGEILFILGKSGHGQVRDPQAHRRRAQARLGPCVRRRPGRHPLSEEFSSPTRASCGMVFQHPALLDSLDVYGNVAFGLRTPAVHRAQLARP